MREKLNEAVKAAMRAKDQTRLTTLRMITSKIKDIEVLNVRPAGQEQASEAEILDVLAKMVKQRRDSIEAFDKMARTDLADKERAEIGILEEFMPKGLSEAEMKDAVAGINGVKRVISTSAEGLAMVGIELRLEIDPQAATAEVREKVAAIRARLPEQIKDPTINRFDVSALPIATYAVGSATLTSDVTRRTVEDDLKPLLSQVDGVAAAEGKVSGYAQLVDAAGDPVGDPGQGAPTFGETWMTVPELNPYRIAEGHAPNGPDEIVIDRHSARTAGIQVGDLTTVLTKHGSEQFTVSGITMPGNSTVLRTGTITSRSEPKADAWRSSSSPTSPPLHHSPMTWMRRS